MAGLSCFNFQREPDKVIQSLSRSYRYLLARLGGSLLCSWQEQSCPEPWMAQFRFVRDKAERKSCKGSVELKLTANRIRRRTLSYSSRNRIFGGSFTFSSVVQANQARASAVRYYSG